MPIRAVASAAYDGVPRFGVPVVIVDDRFGMQPPACEARGRAQADRRDGSEGNWVTAESDQAGVA